MAKNITIDELAAMTQRGLADVEQRIGERMDIRFSALTTLMQDMLAEVTATHADACSGWSAKPGWHKHDAREAPLNSGVFSCSAMVPPNRGMVSQ